MISKTDSLVFGIECLLSSFCVFPLFSPAGIFLCFFPFYVDVGFPLLILTPLLSVGSPVTRGKQLKSCCCYASICVALSFLLSANISMVYLVLRSEEDGGAFLLPPIVRRRVEAWHQRAVGSVEEHSSFPLFSPFFFVRGEKQCEDGQHPDELACFSLLFVLLLPVSLGKALARSTIPRRFSWGKTEVQAFVHRKERYWGECVVCRQSEPRATVR